MGILAIQNSILLFHCSEPYWSMDLLCQILLAFWTFLLAVLEDKIMTTFHLSVHEMCTRLSENDLEKMIGDIQLTYPYWRLFDI